MTLNLRKVSFPIFSDFFCSSPCQTECCWP